MSVREDQELDELDEDEVGLLSERIEQAGELVLGETDQAGEDAGSAPLVLPLLKKRFVCRLEVERHRAERGTLEVKVEVLVVLLLLLLLTQQLSRSRLLFLRCVCRLAFFCGCDRRGIGCTFCRSLLTVFVPLATLYNGDRDAAHALGALLTRLRLFCLLLGVGGSGCLSLIRRWGRAGEFLFALHRTTRQ